MYLLFNFFEGSNEQTMGRQQKQEVLYWNVGKCCLRGRGLWKSRQTLHVRWSYILFLFIYLIFKVLLQLSINYKILEHEIYTNTIVKYNNYIDTTKTLRIIRTKDKDLKHNQQYRNLFESLFDYIWEYLTVLDLATLQIIGNKPLFYMSIHLQFSWADASKLALDGNRRVILWK